MEIRGERNKVGVLSMNIEIYGTREELKRIDEIQESLGIAMADLAEKGFEGNIRIIEFRV